MSRKALITGGAGFIGSHLSELLLDNGWEVFVLDDVSTGSLDNIAHLRDRPDYHLVVDSVLSPAIVSEVVHKCDVVFHLAAAVGVRLIVEQPVHTMVTNVQGTETVLGYCSKFGKRVLVASSSEVYGDHREERPLTETDRRVYGPTTEKRWLYADSKAMDEHLALSYHLERELDTRDRAALQHRRPAAERPLRDGDPALRRARADSASRSRCTATGPRPAPSATSRTPSARSPGLMDATELSGEIFNVGSSERVSILELAERVKRATDSSSELTFVPYDRVYDQGIEDTLHREPATAKIKDAIGWQTTLDLDRIIADVVEHARDRPATASVESVGSP